MITRVGMAPRVAGIDAQTCQERWRTGHADLAAEIPGLRGYTQNHSVLRDGRALLPYPGFDVCSDLQFDDLAGMDAGFASEHYTKHVRADEQGLIDKTRFGLVVGDHAVLAGDDPVPEGAVKLMTFLRAAADPDDLVTTLAGPYADAARAAAPLRHEQIITQPAAHGPGRHAAAYDAVDILWFADADTALDAVLGALAQDAYWLLAGRARGVDRLIAQPHRVV